MIWIPFLLAALCACGPAGHRSPPTPAGADGIEVRAIAEGVWVHTSTRDLPGFGSVPSNGVIVRGDGGALIVDTAWTPEQTAQLLDWVATNVGPVRAVIVTHWHADRIGGLPEVHGRGIPSYGSRRTIQQAEVQGVTSPENGLDDVAPLSALGVEGEVFYPGPGHTVDNVVVWLRSPSVLIGGCLIKAEGAKDLGNVADADVLAWAASVRRVRDRYSGIVYVVPGHGLPGGASMLAHTIALAEKAASGTTSNLDR